MDSGTTDAQRISECVKQELSENECFNLIQPKIEFKDQICVDHHEIVIKEEHENQESKDEYFQNSEYHFKSTVLRNEYYIEEEFDDVKLFSMENKCTKEEKDEIEYSESKVCDNIGDKVNYVANKEKEPTYKQEVVNGKNRSRRVYTCTICQKVFSVYRYFEAHRKQCDKKTSSTEKLHECQECNYKSTRPCNLRRHMLSHSGERPYHCNECDYKAIHKSHLQVHIKYKHTKEKPYGCDLCDYKCTQYYMLNKHKVVHQTEKPFQCDVCSKKFKQNSCLRLHMYCHTKEQKPYKCSDCEFSAFTPSLLQSHIKHTHSNEKPFQCKICDYKTVSSTTLKRHMYKHSEDKPFKCDECSYQCVLKRHLRKHISSKHVKVETR